jgi:ATP-dependent exoDNAse (exonuclease V) alpha subunit
MMDRDLPHDPETAVSRIIELVTSPIPKRFGLAPIRDVQVLCPMNRGGIGARSLNIELQVGWQRGVRGKPRQEMAPRIGRTRGQ